MKKNCYTYKKYTEMTVNMQSQEDSDLQVLWGKVLLNETESQLTFVQNKPRGPRSLELMRTMHSRLLRRPNGGFTLTFRFDSDEHHVMQQMMEEMTQISERLGVVNNEKGGK